MLVEEKSKFVALYLEEPGRTAEIFGPDANEVRTGPHGEGPFPKNITLFGAGKGYGSIKPNVT